MIDAFYRVETAFEDADGEMTWETWSPYATEADARTAIADLVKEEGTRFPIRLFRCPVAGEDILIHEQGLSLAEFKRVTNDEALRLMGVGPEEWDAMSDAERNALLRGPLGEPTAEPRMKQWERNIQRAQQDDPLLPRDMTILLRFDLAGDLSEALSILARYRPVLVAFDPEGSDGGNLSADSACRGKRERPCVTLAVLDRAVAYALMRDIYADPGLTAQDIETLYLKEID